MTSKTLMDEVKEAGKILGVDNIESLRACVQCGKCTGSCPSGRLTALRTRKLFLKVQLDMKDVISEDALWYCTTCYTCYERCPRGVKTTDIIRAIRNIAVKEGLMSDSHRKVVGYVLKTGHAVPINTATMKLREKLGLEKIPPTTHKHREALESVQKIVRKTGLDKLIGFDWEEAK